MAVHNYIARFNSLSDMLESAREGMKQPVYLRGQGSWEGEWGGDKPLVKAISDTINGCAENSKEMRKAQELIDKIDAGLRDREGLEWMPSVMGPRMCVGEALVGVPTAARRKQPVESERAPVRIFLNVATICTATHQEMLNRGCAIAALAMRMSEERVVEVHIFSFWKARTLSDGGDTVYMGWCMKLDTNPISLAHILSTTAHISFVRGLNFCAAAESVTVGSGGKLQLGMYEGFGLDVTKEHIEKVIGIEPHDVWIGSLLQDEGIQTNPVKWVHDRLERQRSLDEGV